MSKAAYIIKQPTCCGTCPMSGTGVCRKWDPNSLGSFPDACPLAHVPGRKRVYLPEESPQSANFTNIANAGWNACLDTLEGNKTDSCVKEVIAAAVRQDKECTDYAEAVLRIAQDHSMEALDFTMLKEFSMATQMIGDMIKNSLTDFEKSDYDYDSDQPAEAVKVRDDAVKLLAKLKILIDAYVLVLGAADGEVDGYIQKLMENKGEEIEKCILKL